MERAVRIHCRGAPSSRIRYPPTMGCRSLFSSRALLKPQIALPFPCRKASTNFLRPSAPLSFFHSNRHGFYKTSIIFTAVCAAAAVPLVKQKSENEAPETEGEDVGTFEQAMLDISEDERKEHAYGVSTERSIIYRMIRNISVAFFRYVYEPIATGLRFIQLVFIFVPVIATIPIIFVGSRDAEHDNERVGTLWWYSFLVRQMERAGPTFIKVCFVGKIANFSWANGQLLEPTFFQQSCVFTCQNSIQTSKRTAYLRHGELSKQPLTEDPSIRFGMNSIRNHSVLAPLPKSTKPK